MNDWIDKLHGFLTINDRQILQDAGKVSHELMVEIAGKKFEAYKQIEAMKDIDFDKVALRALDIIKKRKTGKEAK